VQRLHWRKLPYWVLTPVGFSLLGSIVLIWYHPSASPLWGIAGQFCARGSRSSSQLAIGAGGRARLAQDPAGPDSPSLAKILNTDWVRTLLVSSNALILLFWALMVL